MHKKSLVAVFVLGLLLTTSAFGWAAPVPPEDGVFLRERAPDKAAPQQRVAETAPAIHTQAGTPLAVQGTFCTGLWQGPQTYRIPGWMTGGESYAVFQDPTSGWPYSFGAGCTPPQITFNVTAAVWRWTKRATGDGFINPYTYDVQPVVFDVDLTNPACPVPGGVKCAGPVYLLTLNNPNATGGVTYELNLPFTVECCVTGPYFIGAYLPTVWAPTNGAQILLDDGGFYWPGPVPGQLCRTYNDYGAGWVDLNSCATGDPCFEINLLLWSEGYTPADPATQCTPGACDWKWWYDGARQNDFWYTAYGLPGGGPRDRLGVRWDSDGLDTLKSVSFLLYGGFTSGTPDITVEVWDGDGPASSCSGIPLPGTLRYSVTVPFASLNFYPMTTDVTLPDITWGILNGGPTKYIYVTISEASGGVNGATALAAGDPTSAGCPIDPHSVAHYAGGANLGWKYLGEAAPAFTQREFWMDAFICKEVVPIVEANCAAAGPDDWNTYAHDYQRTSLSTINLGDPCKVRAQWSTHFPHNASFNNPVVAGGKVYASSDNEVNVYDLASGVHLAQVGSFPYTGGQVRSNVSVEGNRVFLTGGTANSVSCWDTSLTTAFWSNDLMGPGLSTTAHGSLLTRNRFGAATVYAVGADSIVVIGTEMTTSSNHGWLYAFDVATGYLYSGWGTNPVPLDKGAWYTPSFDGTNLYVGTATFPSLGDGSLYSVNAATGLVNWNYKDASNPLEGWPSGVSVEGNTLYGATYYNDAVAGLSSGHRYSIDKAGLGPVVNWKGANGPTLYGTPTVGRNFVYISQDDPSAGVLMVDKAIGKVVYNWSANGVTSVPMNVAMTCDKYLFAGTRDGYWYLLNATDQSMEWRREFPLSIVNGTALSHHPVTGDDYALVSVRSSVSDPSGFGEIVAWRLNQAPRPFARQNVYETPLILVPLNSGDGLAASQAGVYSNDGCLGLNITLTNIIDVAPAAQTFNKLQKQYAAAYADRKTGADYLTYFEGGQPSKQARLAGAGLRADDGELTVLDKMADDSRATVTKRSTAVKAASANDVVRTHVASVTYSANPIPVGGTTNMSWLFDGTLLGRGLDDEYIESVMDDPDFYSEDLGYALLGYPALLVHYVGGCPEDNVALTWNTLGAPNVEKVWNHGAMGDSKSGALTWGADANWGTSIFDGTYMLIGDSSAAVGGSQMFLDYYNFKGLFVPNPRLSDAVCGFDQASDVLMGYRREGGCPGQEVPIYGSWVQSNYADTNQSYATTDPKATLGTNTIQTEIGANDPIYGDFKLIEWKVSNRDAVDKPGLRVGTYFDWDVSVNGAADIALISDNFNGYSIYSNNGTPGYAYGMLDPNQPTSYCGVNPAAFSPHKIYSSASTIVYNHAPGRWVGDSHPSDEDYGWFLSTRPPLRFYEFTVPSGQDRGGWLIGDTFALPASGSHSAVQALYAVPAAGGDPAIDAAATALAKRAARWGGFARGDVNDDGCVNLADACWVLSTNRIYPDTYCGDVNLDGLVNGADQTYLLNYVSGVGPAPQGKFRFSY